MKRIVVGLLIVVAFAASGLTWHWLSRQQTYYTDADTIRELAASARPRDILWQPPVALPESINTGEEDYEPRLSADGLTLYFVRGKAGGSADIYTSIRTTDGWSEPEPLFDVNSEFDDLGPELSADGRLLYFYSNRPNGAGGYDLWVAQRGEEGWLPASNLGPQINTGYNEYGPALTPDGQTLYFASNRPRPDDERQPIPDAWPATLREDHFHRDYDLYVARVSETGVGAAEPLTALNTPHNDGGPGVSPLGDFLYFTSDRPAGLGGFDLYRSRRLRGHHEPPANLGAPINTSANELDPGLATAGYAVYFSSDRAKDERSSSDATPAVSPAPLERPRATRDYDLYASLSREVFTETESGPPIDWAGIWSAIGPNLLWALLALLLMLLLLALLRDGRYRRLSLLTKCLLGSIFAHLLLMLLFNFWEVTASVAGYLRRGGSIQVALVSPAATDSLSGQIRGALTSVDVALPAIAAPIERATPLFELTPLVTMSKFDVASTALDSNLMSTAITSVDEAALRAPQMNPRVPNLEPVPLAAELALQLPNETVRRSGSEPTLRVSPAQAAQPDRPAIAAMSSLAAPTVERVDLAPAENRSPLPETLESVAQSPDASDAVPSFTAPLPAPAPQVAAAVPTAIDVRLPGVAPSRAAAATPEPTPDVVPRMTHLPRAAAPTHDLALPTDATVVELTPDTSAAPIPDRTLADVPQQTWADAQPASSAPEALAAVPTAARLPEIDVRLPADPRAEPSKPEPPPAREQTLAMTPTAAPPPSRPQLQPSLPVSAATPEPLVTLPPSEAADPAQPPDSLADVTRIQSDPTRPAAAPVLASIAPVAPKPLDLTLSLPTEEQPPEDQFAQRAPEQRSGLVERMGGSDETERAVAAALKWLAIHQSDSGAWDGDDFDDRCGGCDGKTDIPADAALTGLTLLCFLGADHTHAKDGPYRENIERAVKWLLARQDSDGDLRNGETMYSHGIATIALSEAYAMTRDPELAEPVRKAAAFIAAARNTQVGGWRYEPGDAGDTSVLGWQVMALKSARLAGVEVPEEAFESARQWLTRVTRRNRPGQYAYQPGRRPSPAMTAEGMFVQQLLGKRRGDEHMQASADYVLDNLPDWEDGANTYYWYYATLALFQHGGDEWQRWNESIKKVLLANQEARGRAAGSWDPVGEWAHHGGRIYQTTLCTLMLEVYYRYLPLYTLDRPARKDSE